MEKAELLINGSKGKSIQIDISYIRTYQTKPVIVFCHGFKGFKNWGHFDLIAQYCALQGFVFVKFNFSHNGTTIEQPLDFADLQAFGDNNFSIELNDLGFVLDHLETHADNYEVENREIYLIGHSRGGGIAILKAQDDNRIKKLCTWASIKDVSDFFLHQNLEKWKAEGQIYTFNARTGQNMPLHFQMYENYVMNKVRLDIQQAAKNIRIPWLIIHGTNDTSVPHTCAEQLHLWNPQSELTMIESADHTFGGKHPWMAAELPEHTNTLLNKTISFLKK